MQLDELAKRVGVEVLTPGRRVEVQAETIYAGDRISDLLNAAAENVLLVSNLPGSHLLRLAELMDVPGICLVNGQHPENPLIETARKHGTLLMVSSVGLFETCGQLFRALDENRRTNA